MTQKMAAPPDDDDDDNVADADDECGHHKEREGNQGEVSLKQSIGEISLKQSTQFLSLFTSTNGIPDSFNDQEYNLLNCHVKIQENIFVILCS